MKKIYILYIMLMFISFIFTYIFICDGVNIMVKNYVNYQEKSDASYVVYVTDNDIYNSDILDMDKRYIANLVDNILIKFNYDILFDKYLNGSYSYRVDGALVMYEDDINEHLLVKDYILLPERTLVIDENNVNKISIVDEIEIDYQLYRDILDGFNNKYDIDISGYLDVKIEIDMMMGFNGFSKQIDDNRVIELIIPLSYDSFKINVINNNNKIDNYYEFTRNSDVNYLFLILGIISFAIGITFLIMIIREMIRVYKYDDMYNRELRRILREYDDIIIKVDRLYNKRKYNLIYVDSFNELMDVYKKVNVPISYREMEKKREAIFLIIEDDNAWIYRLVKK